MSQHLPDAARVVRPGRQFVLYSIRIVDRQETSITSLSSALRALTKRVSEQLDRFASLVGLSKGP